MMWRENPKNNLALNYSDVPVRSRRRRVRLGRKDYSDTKKTETIGLGRGWGWLSCYLRTCGSFRDRNRRIHPLYDRGNAPGKTRCRSQRSREDVAIFSTLQAGHPPEEHSSSSLSVGT